MGAAKQAQHDFARLQGYFESTSSLSLALGWSASTVRAWLSDETFPKRPRMRSVETVRNLLDLASRVDVWVSDPFDVGRWMTNPRKDLGLRSPATFVRHLGRSGVDRIAERLPTLAPRVEATTKVEPMSFEQLDEVLANFAPQRNG